MPRVNYRSSFINWIWLLELFYNLVSQHKHVQLNPVDVINSKKQHVARYANQNGSDGKLITIESNDNWILDPKEIN